MSQIWPVGEKICSGQEISDGQTDHNKAPTEQGPNYTKHVLKFIHQDNLKCFSNFEVAR